MVGAVLVISAVSIASLKGNDKPEIETNPPADNEQPASTPQKAVHYTDSPDEQTEWGRLHGPQVKTVQPDDDEEDDEDDDDQGNGIGNGQSDADKTHGLERAIEVHLRNMEKQDAKGGEHKSTNDGKGLENSLAHLQDNLDKQSNDKNSPANANSHNT